MLSSTRIEQCLLCALRTPFSAAIMPPHEALRPASTLYSTECLEGGFPEVRLYAVFSEDEMSRPTPHTQYPKGSATVRRALKGPIWKEDRPTMDVSSEKHQMTAGWTSATSTLTCASSTRRVAR